MNLIFLLAQIWEKKNMALFIVKYLQLKNNYDAK